MWRGWRGGPRAALAFGAAVVVATPARQRQRTHAHGSVLQAHYLQQLAVVLYDIVDAQLHGR